MRRGGGREPAVERVRRQCCLMVKIAGSREKWGEPGFSLSSGT